MNNTINDRVLDGKGLQSLLNKFYAREITMAQLKATFACELREQPLYVTVRGCVEEQDADGEWNVENVPAAKAQYFGIYLTTHALQFISSPDLTIEQWVEDVADPIEAINLASRLSKALEIPYRNSL